MVVTRAVAVRILLPALAAVLLLAASRTEAHAQDPTEPMYACYVPNSGTVYRIKAPGLPDECKAKHIEFSFFAKGDTGDTGPQGEQGEQGPQGEQGEKGEPGGVAGYEVITVYSTLSSENSKGVLAVCPAGKVALGGSTSTQSGPGGQLHVLTTGRLQGGDVGQNLWSAEGHWVPGITPFDWYLVATVVCAYEA